jgi:hypothetical protein
MRYVKTVKKFVSGSEKFFDIFECTYTEVDQHLDSSGRKSMSVKVNDKEYKGLHNKKVFEFLCENECRESFLVLWKSPKGNHMLTYVWELWSDYLEGNESNDVKELSEREYKENGEAFVYMWIDRSNDMKYIGKHKGTLDDGYVCSNTLMLEAYEERPQDFSRTILAWGTDQEISELETILLLSLKAARGSMYYNLSDNLRK